MNFKLACIRSHISQATYWGAQYRWPYETPIHWVAVEPVDFSSGVEFKCVGDLGLLELRYTGGEPSGLVSFFVAESLLDETRGLIFDDLTGQFSNGLDPDVTYDVEVVPEPGDRVQPCEVGGWNNLLPWLLPVGAIGVALAIRGRRK